MNTGVINFFEENLFWHLILQGSFFTICVMIGLCILFHSLEYFLKIYEYTNEFNQIIKVKECIQNTFSLMFNALLMRNDSSEKKKEFLSQKISSLISFLPILLIFIVITFGFGILTNRLGDNFLDNGNRQHLGLKSIWLGNNFEDTDAYIKKECFNHVFSEKANLAPELKTEIYYDIKNQLLKSSLWRNYLSTSQTLINYSQVLMFSFFTLIILLTIDFFLNYIINLHFLLADTEKRGKLKFTLSILLSLSSIVLFFYLLSLYEIHQYSWLLFIALLLFNKLIFIIQRKLIFSNITIRFALIIAALALYYSSGISWLACEREFDYKVFGVYKSGYSNEYNNTYRCDLDNLK